MPVSSTARRPAESPTVPLRAASRTALELRGQHAVMARLRLGELAGVGAEEDLQHPGESELAEARLGLLQPRLQGVAPSRGQRECPPPPAPALDPFVEVARGRESRRLGVEARVRDGEEVLALTPQARA